ncbi:hypothetical protein MKW98_017519 [Papaver atlanticum]|uniref:2-(3-amino-3-carboxypropyl)histidine synthase subunit 2 n=1 Tax=Papaver atlanticum TaxID=357466 RepID=A0AAD4TEF2_9MAGN|nr:hypothetical protein MKW98_017519 [Papaver atlanticum]
MDFTLNYDITQTANFIHTGNFTRVALQKGANLLTNRNESSDDRKEIGLYVLADTTYGSCCVDEVGASHVDADCVVHYGHTCFSPTTTSPAFCVFGTHYGAEGSSRLHFADVTSSVINPLQSKTPSVKLESSNGCTANGSHDDCEGTDSTLDGFKHSIGGLTWNLPQGHKMEDYMLFWIGLENPAFSNLVLTYNSSDIVRYDPVENCIMKDVSQTKKILQRRYYIVEKAKDANIIGILVGTLGVAGYLNMINQMKALIARAGKKAYTLLMGKPNPAKLANFPEQRFLSPVITPYEAILAFNRGSHWTGEYVIGFQDLMTSYQFSVDGGPEEARFSFRKGCYVEDFNQQESVNDDEDKERAITDLAEATHKALQLHDKYPKSIIKGAAKSGAEFFSSRSYQGLEMQTDDSVPRTFVTGRTGWAAGYTSEPNEENKFMIRTPPTICKVHLSNLVPTFSASKQANMEQQKSEVICMGEPCCESTGFDRTTHSSKLRFLE